MTPMPSTFQESKRAAVADKEHLGEQPHKALDRETIAELPAKTVGRMDREELARVVRSGGIPASGARLEYLDRGTLERLAHQARLCCQNHR